MANPFDQFDQPAANPFDQFDQQSAAPTEEREAAPASTRFARGMAEPVIGAGQLMSRPLALVGKGLDQLTEDSPLQDFADYLQLLPSRNDAIAKTFAEESEAMAPEGMDWAGAAGSATTLLPTAFAGGVPATLGKLAVQGGATGGVAGATAISEGDFASDKIVSTLGGATLGAVAAPAAGKLFQLIGQGGRSLLNSVKPSATLKDVKNSIYQIVDQAGLDRKALGDAYVTDLAKQVKSAQRTGGTLDVDALARKLTFKQVGVQGTRGQITQDPIQFSDEMFLRQAKGGEKLADQYMRTLQTLNTRIDDILRSSGTPTKDVEAGRRVFAAFDQIDKPVKASINKAYDVARNTDVGVQSGGLRQVMTRIESALDEADLDPRVSGKLMAELGRLRELTTSMEGMQSGSFVPLKELEKSRRFFSTLRGSSDANEARLAGAVVRAYDKAIADLPNEAFAGPSGRIGGGLYTEAPEKFTAARKMASTRFKQIESLPVLDKYLSGKIAPDDFMKKAVYSSKVDELRNLKKYLGPRSDSWGQIKTQVIADLKDAATRGSDRLEDFSQASFNKFLNAMDKSDKLRLVFTPKEISMLRAVGRVGKDVQVGPPGQLRTGFAGNAKSIGLLMRLIEKIPGRAGAAGRAVGERAGFSLSAEQALKEAPIARPPSTRAPNLLARPAAPLGAVLGTESQ